MARPLTWDFVLLTLLLTGLAYFAVNAFWMEGGFSGKAELEQRRSAAQGTVSALEARRKELEARVKALAGPEVDRDLLDEQARAKLGYGRGDDVLLAEPEGGLR